MNATTWRLDDDAFEVATASASARFAYAEVERLRLSFRPRSLAFRVYRLDVRLRDGRSVTLSSAEPAGGLGLLGLMTRRDAEFSAFARGLVAHVRRAAPSADVLGGLAPWRVGAALVIAVLVVGLGLMRVGQAATRGETLEALFWGLALAGFCAFNAVFLWRNRPRRFADALPDDALPSIS